MASYTNKGSSDLVLNVKAGERVKRVTIRPGATEDFDPVETPVFKHLVESEVLVKGAAKTDEKAPAKAKG